MGFASRLFNGASQQTLYARVTPSPEQVEFLQTQWNELADHLKHELPQQHGYAVSTWLQGSYKYATLIKPVHKGERYDVDLGVYFEWDPRDQDIEPTPRQLRDWVQRELQAYQAKTKTLIEVVEPPKDRCSRAVYEQQFHIDTPTYHLDRRRDRRRLAHLEQGWEDRDPKPLYKWFKDVANGEGRDQMRRLIRYLKAWAAIGFRDAPDARPSSLMLSVLVAESYCAFMRQLGRLWEREEDDDALRTVVRDVHERLLRDPAVPNPVAAEENLNRIHADQWHVCLSRWQALREAAEASAVAEDEITAALAWSQSFAFLMPLPEAEEIEVVNPAGAALMVLPEIRVDVYARKPRRHLTSHLNGVPGVARDCDLVFTITNPHVVPDMATVEWTVRNDGQESASIGDLGHRWSGARMFSVEEKTAYTGSHHMDCVIRVYGSVYAVRRVPVVVRDMKHLPPPGAGKPAWRRLKSAKKRW
jgi:ribosomal protein S15P/S13E